MFFEIILNLLNSCLDLLLIALATWATYCLILVTLYGLKTVFNFIKNLKVFGLRTDK